MASSNQLVELLQALDGPQHKIAELNRYYSGDQALTFVAPEVQKALANRFPRVTVNYVRLAVNAIAERLRVQGFGGADAWPIWLANDLDQRSALVHREALLTGAGYVSVWSNADGSPRIAVESCREVITTVDPGSRETVAAVKRYRTKKTTEAYLYLPDRIEHHRANTAGAATAGFKLVEVLDNPMGQVPIVAFRNSDLPLDGGVSEVHDLTDLVDMLSKLNADIMVSSEYGARPRRWVTGFGPEERPKVDPKTGLVVIDTTTGEPVMETFNPFPETDRMMLVDEPDAKVGQLPAADLKGYQTAVDIILSEIAAIACLPPHFVGLYSTGNPTSADALRASEAGLTAKASAKQQVFGQSWEQVMRLAVAVQNAGDPASVSVRTIWNDPATRSLAQEADAAQKLYGGKQLFSRRAILRRMGLTDDEIADNEKELLSEQKSEAYASADPAIMEYNSQYSPNAQFQKAVNETIREAA